MSEVLPFGEVKAHLSEWAERVEHEHERIVVARSGRPSFILVSPEDLADLEETVDVLNDPDLTALLARSRAEADRGESLPLALS